MPIAALAPIVLVALAWVGFCLWDLSRSPARHLPKWLWALIILAAVPVGGLLWLTVGKDDS